MDSFLEQPQELSLPSGKSKLEMAELLLKQNTLCFQLMLQNQLNQPENFPNYDMSLLEGTVRNNHLLTYNLIMSYVSEEYVQKRQEELNEVMELLPSNTEPIVRNEQVLEEQSIQVQVREEVNQQHEEEKIQEEEQKEEEVAEIESVYDDLFFYDFCENHGSNFSFKLFLFFFKDYPKTISIDFQNISELLYFKLKTLHQIQSQNPKQFINLKPIFLVHKSLLKHQIFQLFFKELAAFAYQNTVQIQIQGNFLAIIPFIQHALING